MTALAVFAGASYSAALRTDGTLTTWGANSSGQLGDTTTTQRLSPVTVVGVPATTMIASAGSHMLALTSEGAGWTWGLNTSGQQGDGTTTNHATPQHSFTLTGTWGATPVPVLSLSGGTYSSPQTLTVTEPLAGAVVRYTTTGAIPTETDAELPPDGTFAIDGYADAAVPGVGLGPAAQRGRDGGVRAGAGGAGADAGNGHLPRRADRHDDDGDGGRERSLHAGRHRSDRGLDDL